MKEYSLCNDKWIKDSIGLITPFSSTLIREVDGRRVLSYGLSSYGYDLRLSREDFYTFRHLPGKVVDPKKFNPGFLDKSNVEKDENGEFFVIPGGSYALGVSVEKVCMPSKASALCIGKSTYARAGLIANLTPIEAGWQGYITLEFSNSSPADIRIYANEGVVQLIFFKGEECETSYKDRVGKYNNQPAKVILPRV